MAARLLRIEKEILNGMALPIPWCLLSPAGNHPAMLGLNDCIFSAVKALCAGAMQEVQGLLDESDPVEETGPSVIPVRLS